MNSGAFDNFFQTPLVSSSPRSGRPSRHAAQRQPRARVSTAALDFARSSLDMSGLGLGGGKK